MYKDHYVGRLGEDMAVKFLMKRGFSVLDRNYRKKMGELDIIAKKDKMVHFFEVKSVTQETFSDISNSDGLGYKPEDNVHGYKQKKIAKMLQIYLLDKFKTTDIDWEFSVICVHIDQICKIAHVRLIPDVVLNA